MDSRRPRAIEELGIPCERRLIDLAAKGTRERWFLEKNPNGKVPVLEVDGISIYESTAILLYLAETYGVDQGLFPPPGIRRAQAFQWIVWAQVTLAAWMERSRGAKIWWVRASRSRISRRRVTSAGCSSWASSLRSIAR